MGAGVYATGAVAGAPAAVYAGAGSYAGAPVVSAPAVVGQTHQTYAAGAPQSNSILSTELSAIRLSRLESRVLLPDTSSLLLESSTFPSPLPLMLLESSRTPLSPCPLLPQCSPLPQHPLLPSPLHPGTLDPPLLTQSPSRGSSPL